MRAHLFLPKNGSPPYQTVIFFPAGDAFRLPIEPRHVARVGGLHHPERTGVPLSGVQGDLRADATPDDERDRTQSATPMIAWSRDLGRAIDYLETRPDIDPARLAFYGVSAGAGAGVVLTALEARLKTTVLQGAGLGRRAARNRRAQLCAAHPHTDADAERPLRLRAALRDARNGRCSPCSELRPSTNGTRSSRPATRCRWTMSPARSSRGSTAIWGRSRCRPLSRHPDSQ